MTYQIKGSNDHDKRKITIIASQTSIKTTRIDNSVGHSVGNDYTKRGFSSEP